MYAQYAVGNTTRSSALPSTALIPAPLLRIFPKILNAPFAALVRTTSQKKNKGDVKIIAAGYKNLPLLLFINVSI